MCLVISMTNTKATKQATMSADKALPFLNHAVPPLAVRAMTVGPLCASIVGDSIGGGESSVISRPQQNVYSRIAHAESSGVDSMSPKRFAWRHGWPLTATLSMFSIAASSTIPTKENCCVAPLLISALLSRFTTRTGCPPAPGLMSNAFSTCPL